MLKFKIVNMGDESISVRDSTCELIELKPGDECETERMSTEETYKHFVVTNAGQPHAIVAVGGYN